MTREEEGVALAAGLAAAGEMPAVIMQQSGVGNCLNAVFTLADAYNLYFPILVATRSEEDENPVQRISVRSTGNLLELVSQTRLDWSPGARQNSSRTRARSRKGGSFFRRDCLEPIMFSRQQLIKEVVHRISEDDRLITPLGFLTREAYAETSGMRERCFYCYGSMGSVIPFSLGLALGRPALRFWAVEGDGALLMNLGALVTLRRYGPANLTVLVSQRML